MIRADADPGSRIQVSFGRAYRQEKQAVLFPNAWNLFLFFHPWSLKNALKCYIDAQEDRFLTDGRETGRSRLEKEPDNLVRNV